MFKRNSKKLILILSAVFLMSNQSSFANKAAGSNINTPNKNDLPIDSANKNYYLPYLQVGGTRFFNIDKGSNTATGADLFIPIWQNPTNLVFSDLRLYDRSGKPWEGNIHLGYRHLNPEQQYLYGFYGAFDRKRFESGNYFNQLTVGGECWINKFFIGGNYYFPIGAKMKLASTRLVEEFDPETLEVHEFPTYSYEHPAGGFDAQIGYELVKGLTAYVGGFYFKEQGSGKNVYKGPKAKLSYDFSLDNGKRILGVFDKVGLEVGVQRDKIRGTVSYLNANFRIGILPTKSSNLQGVARHMVDLVRRDVDIVGGTTTVTGPKTLNFEKTKQEILKKISSTQTVDELNKYKKVAEKYDLIGELEAHKVVLMKSNGQDQEEKAKQEQLKKGQEELVKKQKAQEEKAKQEQLEKDQEEKAKQEQLEKDQEELVKKQKEQEELVKKQKDQEEKAKQEQLEKDQEELVKKQKDQEEKAKQEQLEKDQEELVKKQKDQEEKAKQEQLEKDQEELVKKQKDQEELVKKQKDQEEKAKQEQLEKDQEELVKKQKEQEELVKKQKDQEEKAKQEQLEKDQEELVKKQKEQEELVKKQKDQEEKAKQEQLEKDQEELVKKQKDQEEKAKQEQLEKDQEELVKKQKEQEELVKKQKDQEEKAKQKEPVRQQQKQKEHNDKQEDDIYKKIDDDIANFSESIFTLELDSNGKEQSHKYYDEILLLSTKRYVHNQHPDYNQGQVERRAGNIINGKKGKILREKNNIENDVAHKIDEYIKRKNTRYCWNQGRKERAQIGDCN